MLRWGRHFLKILGQASLENLSQNFEFYDCSEFNTQTICTTLRRSCLNWFSFQLFFLSASDFEALRFDAGIEENLFDYSEIPKPSKIFCKKVLYFLTPEQGCAEFRFRITRNSANFWLPLPFPYKLWFPLPFRLKKITSAHPCSWSSIFLHLWVSKLKQLTVAYRRLIHREGQMNRVH